MSDEWNKTKDQFAVDHLGRKDHGAQEGDHPDVHTPDYETMADDCREYIEAKIGDDLEAYAEYVCVTTTTVPYGSTTASFETYDIDDKAYVAVAEECWSNGLINYEDGKYVVEEG